MRSLVSGSEYKMTLHRKVSSSVFLDYHVFSNLICHFGYRLYLAGLHLNENADRPLRPVMLHPEPDPYVEAVREINLHADCVLTRLNRGLVLGDEEDRTPIFPASPWSSTPLFGGQFC